MALAVGDILRVAARHTFRSVDDMVNVFHCTTVTVPGPNTNAALLADISEWVSRAYTSVQAHLQNDLVATDIAVFNVSDDSPVGVVSWSGGYSGGTGSGQALPLAVAALALISTTAKRTQGRLYLSGLGEGELNDSLWDATFVAAYAAMIDTIVDLDTETNGFQHVYGVWKRSDGQMYAVSSIRIQTIPAYQRRRKPGRGS
jgi:hypothetical protein